MPIAYSIFGWLIFALLWPFLVFHRKTRGGQRRRFGFHPPGWMADAPRPRIWLHGASAGDLLALKPMVAELKRRFPGCTVVMSTLTNSGYQMAKERLGEVDFVTYQPWDLAGATRRTVRAIDPDLLVVEYTEMWPNLIRAAHLHGAKVVLTNGRFAEANLRGYQLLFSLVGNPLKNVDLLLMREDDEAERVLRLGARPERVRVTGNTKFDTLAQEANADTAALAQALGPGPFFIAGSTHEGEEALLLPVFRRLREAHPTLRFAIAPRYVERAPRILALAQGEGFRAGLRSKGATQADVVVIDTIGELSAAYGLATLVFVGGSFTNRGGQNILEPAAHGKPVLFGPNMENFHDSVQALVGRGGIQVADPDALLRVAGDLLARPEKIDELGERARAVVRSIRGASARNVDEMAKVLDAAARASRGAAA